MVIGHFPEYKMIEYLGQEGLDGLVTQESVGVWAAHSYM